MDLRAASFAWDLLRGLKSGGNAVCSPESVRIALGMALLGARGLTAEDLARGLRLGEAPREAFHAAQTAALARWSGPGLPYALVAADAMFLSAALRRAKGADVLLQERYLAGMRALDFAGDPARAAGEINAWVKEVTRGLVPEIAGPGSITTATRVVMVNALYFKGEWRTKFPHSATYMAPFEVGPGARPAVSTMYHTAEHRARFGADAEILEMAYRGDDLAMVVVLPPRGTSLDDFERSSSPEALFGGLSELSLERVRVTLPRFSIDPGPTSLRALLESMGIEAPFNENTADFGVFFDDPIVLDDVLHRARIDVDEEGTEAAAATAVLARQSLDRSNPRLFAVDRPFLFFLRDLRDGAILFAGRVTDPR